MCPQAAGAAVKYVYLDHDTDVRSEVPPILNQWYQVFHAYDVRLLWCTVTQTNDEVAAKNMEVRWTIDGTVYFCTVAAANGTTYYIFRTRLPSTAGTLGLEATVTQLNAVFYVDKRGQDFKVEVRMTSALGTNQTLLAYCVRETLEQT